MRNGARPCWRLPVRTRFRTAKPSRRRRRRRSVFSRGVRICALALTGAQVKALIEEGRTVQTSDGGAVAFDYYWSGLQVELRREKVRSAAL